MQIVVDTWNALPEVVMETETIVVLRPRHINPRDRRRVMNAARRINLIRHDVQHRHVGLKSPSS